MNLRLTYIASLLTLGIFLSGMAELNVKKEPIPYDESNYTLNGFTVSHNGSTVESDTNVKCTEFAKDSNGRFWDVEVLPDGSNIVVSVEVNTDQVLEESVEYETNRFDGPSEFCQWLESGSFELVTES